LFQKKIGTSLLIPSPYNIQPPKHGENWGKNPATGTIKTNTLGMVEPSQKIHRNLACEIGQQLEKHCLQGGA